MAKFIVNGGKKLFGEITVAGSKNAVLPMLAASLLTKEKCTFTNVPKIIDVENFIRILQGLGARVECRGTTVSVSSRHVLHHRPDKKLASSMRASVVLLGSLLVRLGKAELAYPGGDLLGARPIDVHLRAFAAMGAKVGQGRTIVLTARQLAGRPVYAESSVTGTENILLAATLASGTTVIKLAAMEPHVAAVCGFLRKMGAKISGVGTTTLAVRGVKKLHGATIRIIPDMIEAGSFALLAAATGSEVLVRGLDHGHMDAVYNKFSEMGINFYKERGALQIRPPRKPYRAAVVRTGLYPNLATDLQPPFGVFATQCEGISRIHDWIYEGRFGYLPELKKMGARVRMIDAHQVEIAGPTALFGRKIESHDIRSGVTMVIAALIARGKSEINDIHHIDRGYERIDERLRALGADIKRVASPNI